MLENRKPSKSPIDRRSFRSSRGSRKPKTIKIIINCTALKILLMEHSDGFLWNFFQTNRSSKRSFFFFVPISSKFASCCYFFVFMHVKQLHQSSHQSSAAPVQRTISCNKRFLSIKHWSIIQRNLIQLNPPSGKI